MSSLSLFTCRATLALGVVGGWLGFIVFWFHYQNEMAAIWALVSGCMAAMVMFQHVMYAAMMRPNATSGFDKKHTARRSYKALFVDGIALFGMIFGLLTSATYVGIGYNSEGLVIPSATELPHSPYTTSAWCFLTFIWSSMLLNFARYYRKLNFEEILPLVQDNTVQYRSIM